MSRRKNDVLSSAAESMSGWPKPLPPTGWHRSLAQADPALLQKATIPVEKIKAPILLVSGTDDQTWPADEFCREIVAKLQKNRFPYEVKHISHEGAGHMSFLPFLIPANRGGISGGSPQEDARAGFISWKETIAFLRRHLGR